MSAAKQWEAFQLTISEEWAHYITSGVSCTSQTLDHMA